MMREDQEIEMIEFVEGKAEDEAEAEEAPNWQNTFHRIAGDITGAFEGGKPGTLNLYDLGIISYGKHQATLASGTLYPILKRYIELSSSETAKKMSAYLERVEQRDVTLREDKDFIQLLKDAAKEPEMNRKAFLLHETIEKVRAGLRTPLPEPKKPAEAAPLPKAKDAGDTTKAAKGGGGPGFRPSSEIRGGRRRARGLASQRSTSIDRC